VSGNLTWYVARATGITAWVVLLASILWGLLLATKVLGKRPAPWWLLGVHTFLGTLAVIFTSVHVGAILLDTFTHFTIVDVFVPFASSWNPVAVAWGVVALYLLLAVELTSLVRKHLSRRLWHGVHLASYGLFATATVHFLTAGTDVRGFLPGPITAGIGAAVLALAGIVWWKRSGVEAKRGRRIEARAISVGVTPES
jgi:hypothetical protein